MKQYHPTLDAIRFCPNCGKPFRTEHCGNHTECPDCGFVLFFNAAAAVAVLLRDAGGRLLLTRRAKEPAKGKLAFPGGFADIFETPEEAACRELAEECGITLPPEKMSFRSSSISISSANSSASDGLWVEKSIPLSSLFNSSSFSWIDIWFS